MEGYEKCEVMRRKYSVAQRSVLKDGGKGGNENSW